MDHKVSKDMISSGMTPSGEKTQADLGRIQYGSAPSPSTLADVYKKMYEVDEAIDPMDFGKSKRTEEEKSKSRNLQSRLPNRSQNAQRKDQLKGTQVKTSTNSVDSTPKPKPSKGFGESSLDLLAAYNAVYEHHKKDADGNTIPHEDEEVNEGKIPAGLQAYLDKKKGKKEDKKEDKKDMKEEVDKFDIVFNHFISEGYSEKEAYSKMSNLTEEQLDEFLKALTQVAQAGMKGAESIGRATRPLVAKAAQRGMNIAKTPSQKIEVTDPKPQARKPFEPKRKPFDAKKPEQKPVINASEVVSAALSKRREEKQQRKDKLASDPKTRIDIKKKEVMQDEYQYIDEYAQLIAKGAAMLSKAAKPVAKIAGSAKKTAGKVINDPTVKNIATQTAVGSMMSGGNQKKQTTGTVSASADLFDIVKGQLLDEGLSEEEIKDIMLTLTPEEILNEISVGKMADYISAADKDVQKTASNIQKGNGVMGDDPRVKKMTQRAKGMAMAGNKIAKKLTPPSMP